MTFEELINRLTPKLRGIAYRLNGRYTVLDHDDLYQETLKHLWEFYKEGKLEGKTDSYILQGCYFYLKNFLRGLEDNTFLANLDEQVGENEDTTLAEMLPEETKIEQEIDVSLLVRGIYECNLTEKEKEVLQLYSEGWTMREVGEELGVSHVTVVKIIEKIREKTKKLIEENI